MSLKSRHTAYVDVLSQDWPHCRKMFCQDEQRSCRKQDVRFANNSEPKEAKRSKPSGQNNFMFLKEDDTVDEVNTVAAFKRYADGETLTKRERMQNDIDAYTVTQVKPKIAVRMNSELPRTSKKGWKEVCGQDGNR